MARKLIIPVTQHLTQMVEVDLDELWDEPLTFEEALKELDQYSEMHRYWRTDREDPDYVDGWLEVEQDLELIERLWAQSTTARQHQARVLVSILMGGSPAGRDAVVPAVVDVTPDKAYL